MEVNGPAETTMVIADPLATRPDGRVPITVPFAISLLRTDDTLAMVKPSAVSTAVAWVTESLATTGTEAYRPEASHQPPSPSPMPSARISTTITSRGLNSQRCRNGSRVPRFRPLSSRCTTSVRELPSSWPEYPDGQTPLGGPVPDGPLSYGPVLGGPVLDGPVPGLFDGGAVSAGPRHSPVPGGLAAGMAPVPRAHQPLVAAGVSRLSQGASLRPWTPTPITPVSPLGSPMPSLTRRTARANSPASAGRIAGSRLVAASTSRSTATGMPGTSVEGAGTSWLTCW